jgi:hypothetical protein
MSELTEADRELLGAAIARLRASVMALVFGMVGGTGLCLATVWLLLAGGEVVGPHLALLGSFFPGYTVTWTGALVGFGYGALTGAALGYSVAIVYNRVASRSGALLGS